MQTFLPYPDFVSSAQTLDKKRCFAQLREAGQIVTLLENEQKGILSRYRNHPAVRGWRGYIEGLKRYYNIFYAICLDVHRIRLKKLQPLRVEAEAVYPPWIGYPPLHASHRGRLLKKAPDFYKKYNWSERPLDSEGYIWPVDKNGKLLLEIETWINSKQVIFKESINNE